MKKCGKCQEEKRLEDFALNKVKRDGRQAYCRKCNTEWAREKYKESPERRRTIVARNQKLKHRNQNAVYEWLQGKACLDCNNPNLMVLTFDHREDKKYTVSDMVQHGYSLDTIFNEIAKCDIRCFNCHMIKDSQRNGGLRWRGTISSVKASLS